MPIVISVGIFIVILALLVFLRTKNSKLEIKSTDIVVALTPVVIFLLVTGSIKSLEVGGDGIKVETVFVNASTKPIAPQVTRLKSLPFTPVRIREKGSVREIPRLIENKAEGLLFRLGYGNYSGVAIEEYLSTLLKQPFLRYIVIQKQNGDFFAIADAQKMMSLLQERKLPYTAEKLAEWLNSSNESSLKNLPVFISSENAMNEKTDKIEALRRMEHLNVDTLPVINDKKQFVGIVNRSRLVASLIIEVVKQLKQA